MFVTNLNSLFRVTEDLKTEKNGKKLADLTRMEGQLTARMLLLSLPEEYLNPKSNIVITKFCRFANNMDSAFDMPRDYRKGEIECKPTISNIMTMFVVALPDIIDSIRYLRPGLNELLQMVDFGFRTISGLNRE